MAKSIYAILCLLTLCHSATLEAEPVTSVDFLKSVVDKLVRASQPVAFTACLTNGDKLGDHQTVEYDYVVSNVGGGYDTRHSHFTAPTSGLYQFSATVMAFVSKSLHLQMVKNGIELINLYSASYAYESGTKEVNIHLNKGDMVWVRNSNVEPDAQLHPGRFNCFSGVLVQADV